MKIKHRRSCSRCGESYWRSNSIRVWTVRNPGHRDGWQKIEEKICLNCLNEGMARKTASFAGLRIVPFNRREVG